MYSNQIGFGDSHGIKRPKSAIGESKFYYSLAITFFVYNML